MLILSMILAATIELRSSPDANIQNLRNIGKFYLNSKDYKRAAEYYSAILQTIEKEADSRSEELRRCCCLTLAQCEIQNGNLFHAIARCTDVLSECPDTLVNANSLSLEKSNGNKDYNITENLQTAMSKALYRRGVSLLRLNKPDLALIDLNHSLILRPDDKNIKKEIELAAQRKKKNGIRSSGNMEDLVDLVEECQLNYPRTTFSRHQIELLASGRSRNVIPAQRDGLQSTFGSSINSISDAFQGSAVDPSNMMKNMASDMLGGKISGKSIVSMLSSVGVIDQATGRRLLGVMDLFERTRDTFSKILAFISENRAAIVLTLNSLLILATLFNLR